MHESAAVGAARCLSLLLRRGADALATDAEGLTALALAQRYGQIACESLLEVSHNLYVFIYLYMCVYIDIDIRRRRRVGHRRRGADGAGACTAIWPGRVRESARGNIYMHIYISINI